MQSHSKYPHTFWGIEHLFGSVTRTRLLRIFLNNPAAAYFMRDLSRRINTQLNAVRRELENLETLGIAASREEGQKKYYSLNQDNLLFPELKALLVKAQMIFEKNIEQVLSAAGQIQLLILTGKFVGAADAPVDMLIIGRVNRPILKKIIDILQNDIGEQINYTVMTGKEYDYRREVTDKFLLGIMENKRVILIDKIKNRSLAK